MIIYSLILILFKKFIHDIFLSHYVFQNNLNEFLFNIYQKYKKIY